MSIVRHAWTAEGPHITSPESMVEAIRRAGIIPFFENPIKGYSIEEMTPPEYWFDGEEDELGPWDWKIEAVRSGDIAYGKFLWGGKAAFATVECYRELVNWRRSLPKYAPDEAGQKILAYLDENGTISIKEIRRMFGIKKAAADNLVRKLQMCARLVTGDIQRVYRGADLHYNGWQTSSFCTPEALFETEGESFGPFHSDAFKLAVPHSPEESLKRLSAKIKSVAPNATDSLILKMLA
ncbi:MAG: MarR family transcriptional regulator [Bacteroidales bacterium]|nr:MarR family transcriptional regulator [Bacteroidales bacterium]